MTKAIILKSKAEIEQIGLANQIVAHTLSMLKSRIESGVSTWQLDLWAEDFCRASGAIPAFKGYRGFPGSLCVSLNEQVVHGIPSKKVVLQDGDILSIDFGVKYKGYYGDSAITVPIGTLDSKILELLKVTEESLYKGIAQAKIGNRIDDISTAVQNHVERYGFSVVRQFVGHGIGANLHEPPEIPNYHRKGPSPRILEGMVFAIEPMINIGTHEVKILKDGWTVITQDKKMSAHFEHTIAVTQDEPLVLSSRD
ncbi:MAG: type I methionyl aminopeptidase [Thermodesulfobacteriota bacterium]|nr:type I methionyl aminopeptidase [Thermodesulfobacteriota bacterium]